MALVSSLLAISLSQWLELEDALLHLDEPSLGRRVVSSSSCFEAASVSELSISTGLVRVPQSLRSHGLLNFGGMVAGNPRAACRT